MAQPDFDPSLPFTLSPPWPGAWGQWRLTYDLYKCEAFLDDAAAMADLLKTQRALQARADALDQLPVTVDRSTQQDTLDADYRTWRRAWCLRQIAYFVCDVTTPTGASPDPKAAKTWDRWPLRMLEWVVNDGFTLARRELWGDPKEAGGTPSTPPSASTPPPVAPR